MDVILHLGAHRTASTSFHHYMRSNAARLDLSGIGFWGPVSATPPDAQGETNLTADTPPEAQFATARDRICENLDHAEQRGLTHLVVSDPNVIGDGAALLRDAQLYGAIGERMARYSQAFGGRLTRIVMMIRSQDRFWGSLAAGCVARGQGGVSAAHLDKLVTSTRNWREVVTDLACAVPDVAIDVQLFETIGGMQERRLAAMTGLHKVPSQHAREWLNRAPGLTELREILTERGEDPDVLPAGEGRWQPFDREQNMALREAYADDLYWLRGGADGLATLSEETGPDKAGKHAPSGNPKRGQTDGKEDRRLA